MGFLVGNDFIPHLPHMHIHTDALPDLWKIYMEVLPKLDGKLEFRNNAEFRRILCSADIKWSHIVSEITSVLVHFSVVPFGILSYC